MVMAARRSSGSWRKSGGYDRASGRVFANLLLTGRRLFTTEARRAQRGRNHVGRKAKAKRGRKENKGGMEKKEENDERE